MRTINRIADLKATIRNQQQQGKRIGFVPTMGNLHEGHISLVRHALTISDYVVSSIFVNPLQFGASEDLDNYPRTMKEDMRKLAEAGAHLLFTPTTEQVYPFGLERCTKVLVPDLTDYHCGTSRPGHFDGVSTVVNILFNMVEPDVAVFGEKDFQQLAVIRKMTKDLFIRVQIEGCPTVRESDGLAMSSRNGYLSVEQRQIANSLYRTLSETADRIRSGARDYQNLQQQAANTLSEAGFKPDYYNIVNSITLEPADSADTEIVILAAAYLGTTRLIDNIYLRLE